MALTAVYERFLTSPNPLSLAATASLHYIPTLTSYTQSGPIIRHLESQNKNVVKTKSAKTIHAVEGPSSLALEVDTTLEFISGGGAYAPGLENFIVDKIATLPLTHIVQFDQDQKISQIRISWDQASLLKQTEVIGSRGRNWPVHDGKDQARLVASSVSSTPVATMPTAPTSPRGRSTRENGFAQRNSSPSKKHVKDPYTSLDLFGAQKPDDAQSQSSSIPIAPRAESFKPPPRDMSELFAAGHEDNEPGSPKKASAIPAVAPKGGSSQKFGPVRLFDEEEQDIISPKIYKTNPARYNHFDIGEPDENDHFQHKAGGATQSSIVPMRAKTTKHASQWDFSDFTNPAKVPIKLRDQDKVQFNWDDENKPAEASPGQEAPAQNPGPDAEPRFELKDDGTPVERKVVPKPRKDQQAHFEFGDQTTPATAKIIARTDAAKGLYHNVLDEDENVPLSDISNNAGRRNDFDNHWATNDKSPTTSKFANAHKGIGGDHKKAIQNMGSSWDNYDQSPDQTKRPTSKAFKKGLEPHWGMGAEDDQPAPANARGGAQKGFWDF